MKKKADESVHVRLEEPVERRRSILQTTIDTMQLSKQYENILHIRQEKHKTYEEFQKILASINRLVKQIRVHDLPLDDEDMKHVKKVKNESIMAPVIKKVEKVFVSQKKEEDLKKGSIDAQIDALQRKLRSL